MKTFVKFCIVGFFGVSCSGTAHIGSTYSDDLYYSPSENNDQKVNIQKSMPQSNTQLSNAVKPVEKVNPENEMVYTSQDFIPSESFDTNSNAAVNKDNNYNPDDYYDYEYASRLRRFHDPYNSWNYYDPYYTNLYWYSGFPSDFGWSIYLGYNWWWGSSFYNPWYFTYANSWCDPYYSFYSPYSYWRGFNDGYWLGYYHSPYYYNSYDDNGIPTLNSGRGHRSGFSTGGNIVATNRSRAGTRESFVEKYDLRKNEIRSSFSTSGNNVNSVQTRRVSVGNNGTIIQDNSLKPGNRPSTQKLNEQESGNFDSNPGINNSTVNTQNRNSFPSGKVVQKEDNGQIPRDNPQNYTPSYSVPRTYERSSYNLNQGNSYEKSRQPKSNEVAPSGNSRKPSNSYNSGNSPGYSAPRNQSNQTYTSPKPSGNTNSVKQLNSGSNSSGSVPHKRGK